ncbi:aminotransferase class III-fold pyridoxal phosphate-dependent enzyme [Demequina sp. NBRC 110056]|uniref:aminotransferase class III-fold pyridoxal phosphate-dependent enzyme n=1 Tax=Demequina sp. NBRC 110056 TaxID=1570345 RepID=UPI000A052E2F|nr:aminotransferase class III-fold pyridoxal phosphate-dependent enzyme [Demequina sp. NBRC 110056]
MTDTLSNDRSYVFHSWSAQATLAPLTIARAEGTRLWDEDGRELLDFSSQLINANIGYGNRAIVDAIKAQAELLTTVAPQHAIAVRGEAARKVVERAPDGFTKVFFTNGGADANENAIRMARQLTGRRKVISGYRSYHGNTGAAVVATGDWRRVPNEYATDHVHVFTPYLYRSEFHAATPEEECERALRHLRRTIEAEGPAGIAAIILETIPGTAGVLVPPDGYLPGVRALCDEFGIVMILDEVMAGFGRSGEWLALDAFGATPDLITFAKGVNSGYVPVGGVIMSERIEQHFEDKVFPGGLTYSGHPIAMASIVASLDALAAKGVIDNAKAVGEDVFRPRLDAIAAARPDVVGEVRGKGVFWAVELVADAVTREPASPATVGAVKNGLIERGVLPIVADNRIHMVPPCVITAEDAHAGLDVLAEVIGALPQA